MAEKLPPTGSGDPADDWYDADEVSEAPVRQTNTDDSGSTSGSSGWNGDNTQGRYYPSIGNENPDGTGGYGIF